MTASTRRRAHGRGAKARRTIAGMAPQSQATSARRAWGRLQQTGGVITRTELQQRWEMSRPRAHEITTREEFPAPVIEGTRGHAALWLVADVEHWRRAWTPQRGPHADRAPLIDQPPDPAAAARAWQQLGDTGGLVTVQALAVAWGISVTGAAKRTTRDQFPPPVTPGRWLAAETLTAAPAR